MRAVFKQESLCGMVSWVNGTQGLINSLFIRIYSSS